MNTNMDQCEVKRTRLSETVNDVSSTEKDLIGVVSRLSELAIVICGTVARIVGDECTADAPDTANIKSEPPKPVSDDVCSRIQSSCSGMRTSIDNIHDFCNHVEHNLERIGA